jgi:ATP-dependent Clp protease adaptor protein ClpS
MRVNNNCSNNRGNRKNSKFQPSVQKRANPCHDENYLICELYKSENAYFCMLLTNAMKPAYHEEELVDVLEATELTEVVDLVVFNDDVNTFDHVIDTLIRVCKHSAEQAEQCTLLIHFKGKCAVKTGTFDFLRPMREAICEAGIDARIV